MTSQELKTYNELTTSNNSFCHALNDNEIKIDNNIKFELIIYYLILNKKYLTPELTEYYEDILYLITSHNFILSKEYILVNSTTLSLDYLTNLVTRIEEVKKEKQDGRVIYLTKKIEQTNPKPSVTLPTEGKILQFKDSSRTYYYTTLERAIAFESNPTITEDTIPYINITRKNFVALMNDIILRILNDNLQDYSIKYLRVLSVYLKLYTLTNYNKETSYHELRLPMNQIGIRKTTHTNEEILSINRKLKDLNRRENRLVNDRERFESDLKIKESILTRIEQEIIEIEKERASLNFRAYLLTHSPEIYNENLLRYLTASFEQGHVEINRFFANPVIKLFYLKNREVEFHCSARLDTLTNLFEINCIEEQKRLKKEV